MTTRHVPMKTVLWPLAIAALFVACANFSTNVWRTEQTAVNTAYASYVAYTNGVASGVIKVSAEQAASIKTARLSFAGSINVVEAWRQAYETNSAVKPQLQAALDAALAQSSNIVWLISFVKGQ